MMSVWLGWGEEWDRYSDVRRGICKVDFYTPSSFIPILRLSFSGFLGKKKASLPCFLSLEKMRKGLNMACLFF